MIAELYEEFQSTTVSVKARSSLLGPTSASANVDISTARKIDGSLAHHLWAKCAIKELEADPHPSEDIKKQIITLSVKYR